MKTHLRIVFISSVAVALILCSLHPTAAFANDSPWQIRFAAVSMNTSSGTVNVPDEDDELYTYDGSNEIGFAIDVEYRASRRLGIDFGMISATPAFDVTVGEEPLSLTASADIRATPIYAALNIHLTPDSRFDLYVGPVLAYVVYEGFDLVVEPGLSESFTVENDFAFGAVVGLDVALGDGGWSLNTAFRYLDSTLEARPVDETDVGTVDMDPMIFSIGVGYRF